MLIADFSNRTVRADSSEGAISVIDRERLKDVQGCTANFCKDNRQFTGNPVIVVIVNLVEQLDQRRERFDGLKLSKNSPRVDGGHCLRAVYCEERVIGQNGN